MTTYTNLGIKEITTGDEAGTWGTSTNTNFTYFDDAIVGSATVTLVATGSAGSPNTLNVANFAASDGRKRIIEVTSATDLGGTCYLQITPNTFHGYYFITNTLDGNRNLTVFQGTWNGTDPNRAITISNGKQTIIKCDGAGVAAVVARVLNNFETGYITADGSGLTGSAPNFSVGQTTVAVDDATAVPVYPIWGDGATGAVNTLTSSALTYQPNTGELNTTVLTAAVVNGTTVDGTFIGTLSGETYSTDDAVVAGTNAQGQSPLTADYNVIITTANNPSGVTLPAALAGLRIIVVNRGTNSVNIYPASGDFIDSLSLNTPIGLTVDGWIEFNASSTSQWYSTANIVVNATGAVTSFSAGTTGLTPSGATTGAVTLGGTLAIANGGTGQTTKSAAFNALSPITSTGDLIIGNGANSATRLAIGTNNYVLTSNGTTASWQAPGSTGVSSFSAGTTGLTPSVGTTGAVTLAGTLAIANGGTGQTTKSAAYNALTPITTTGDLVIGNGTNSATRLPISANNGYVLTSNGTTAAWSLPGASTSDVGTANTTYYPVFTTTTSGVASLNVSSTRLSFNPFTGTLTANTFAGNATTATTATNTTNTAITNDTTNANTCYPTWVTSTTGNLPQTVSSTKFTFVPSTGIVTASGFSGPLNGTVGATTPAAITGTTITANTAFSGPHNGTVGATTPNTGAFTTLSASSTFTASAGFTLGPAAGNGAALLYSDNTQKTVGIATTPSSAGTTRVRIMGMGTTSSTVALKILDNTQSPGAPITLFDFGDDGSFQTATSTSTKNGAPYLNAAGSLTPKVLYVNTSGVFQSQLATTATTGTAAIITTSGLVQQQSSSIRYKQDVQDLVPGLAEVLQLRPITFRSKVEDDDQTRRWGGFIAEEVAAVAGMEPFINYNADGLVESVTYGQITALLVNAIKQQQAQIEALTARVAALEAK